MDEPIHIPDPITTWIHFRVPTGYDVNDLKLSSNESETLVAAIIPVLRAQGQRRSAWGRVQSDPELTVLFSVWESYDSYTAFTASPDGQRAFLTRLAALHPANSDPSNIITLLTTFPRPGFSRGSDLHPHTHLRAIFFPTPLSDTDRAAACNRSGPIYPFGFTLHGGYSEAFAEMSAYHTGPRRGWAQGRVKWPGSDLPGELEEVKDLGEGKTAEEGTECEVFLVVMSWTNGEAEKKFRETAKLMRTEPGEEPGTAVLVAMVPVMEDWEEGLKADGAVGWRDWYVDFEMIGKTIGR